MGALDSPQFKVAAARRMLFRAGLDHDDMAGQVTLRDADDPGAYWTSPMETFDVTTEESVTKVVAYLQPIAGGVTADGRFTVESETGSAVSTAFSSSSLSRSRISISLFS